MDYVNDSLPSSKKPVNPASLPLSTQASNLARTGNRAGISHAEWSQQMAESICANLNRNVLAEHEQDLASLPPEVRASKTPEEWAEMDGLQIMALAKKLKYEAKAGRTLNVKEVQEMAEVDHKKLREKHAPALKAYRAKYGPNMSVTSKTPDSPTPRQSPADFWREQRANGLTPSQMKAIRDSLPLIVPTRLVTKPPSK
jgi:hypothetical protein